MHLTTDKETLEMIESLQRQISALRKDFEDYKQLQSMAEIGRQSAIMSQLAAAAGGY